MTAPERQKKGWRGWKSKNSSVLSANAPLRVSLSEVENGVPVEGLEPPLTCVKQILSLSRLPFRHTGLIDNQRLAHDSSANKSIVQVSVASEVQVVITNCHANPFECGLSIVHGSGSRLAGK